MLSHHASVQRVSLIFLLFNLLDERPAENPNDQATKLTVVLLFSTLESEPGCY